MVRLAQCIGVSLFCVPSVDALQKANEMEELTAAWGGGDSGCPCIDFDDITGDFDLKVNEALTTYPRNFGTSCEAWDNGRYPGFCTSDGEPGKGKGFCAEKWCYIDPCTCENGEPMRADYWLSYSKFKGKPLFYSYKTCGSINVSIPDKKGALIQEHNSLQIAAANNASFPSIPFPSLPFSVPFFGSPTQEVDVESQIRHMCHDSIDDRAVRRQLHSAIESNMAWQDEDMLMQQQHLFMRYMPSHNLVVCSCAKCGSTSLFNYIFEASFNGSKYQGLGEPSIQEVANNSQWKDTWTVVLDKEGQEKHMKEAFTYAIVRDPKERLVSAWKSKLACHSDRFNTDLSDQAWRVRTLKLLADLYNDGSDCISLEEFAMILRDVYRLGRQKYLSRHFLPQNLGCFLDFPPSKWRRVFTADNTEAFQDLAEHLNSTDPLRHDHASTARVPVSEHVAKLLDQVTRDEYEMLAPYLSHESSVIAGAEVLVAELGRFN